MAEVAHANPLRQLVHQLPAIQRRMDAAGDLGAVIAAIAGDARGACGYDRAVLLTVNSGHLLAAPSAPLSDAASDALRRRALAVPVRIEAGSPEAAVIREAEGTTTPHCRRESTLAAALRLSDPVFAALAPAGRVIAVLVVDHPVRQVDPEVVSLFGHVAGLALERAIRRERHTELAAEMRYLTASADALIREASEAALSVPLSAEDRPSFRTAIEPAHGTHWRSMLSEREYEIAELIAAGHSNREIAAMLHLSAETVKSYVSRLMGKLGAANRVQAATRFIGAAI